MAGGSGKYKALTERLMGEESASLSMTFDEVERVLDFHLPESARKHQAWWANQTKGHSLAWVRVGWRTAAVSIDEERLTFVRSAPEEQARAQITQRSPHFAILEAKEALADAFGVDPSQIEITIKA